MPYPGGISDSVIQIKGYDEKGKTLDEKVLCFPKSQDDSIRTIWLNYENKEVPCNYSLNIDKLQKELNSMTQNIRGEYYSKRRRCSLYVSFVLCAKRTTSSEEADISL